MWLKTKADKKASMDEYFSRMAKNIRVIPDIRECDVTGLWHAKIVSYTDYLGNGWAGYTISREYYYEDAVTAVQAAHDLLYDGLVKQLRDAIVLMAQEGKFD